MDQNVQLHLDGHSIAAELEKRALELVAELLGLGQDGVKLGKVFTTGATASNILGLACARESMIRIFSSMPHNSIGKAASVVGFGTANVVSVGVSGQPWRLDLDSLQEKLRASKAEGVLSIVVVGAGEVNTGRFSIHGLEGMQRLRDIVDEYGGWIHIDGAFGIFARILPDTPEFATLRTLTQGVELADSIAIDGRKVLNVPYDCGIFLCRHSSSQKQVFTTPNAAYLATGTDAADLAYLNLGLENSRRFRALPIFATIISEGAAGLGEMHARMVRLARKLSRWLQAHEHYELLPANDCGGEDEAHIIVLFRHRTDTLNAGLIGRINSSRKMVVGPTVWDGRPAVRLAVSTWRVDVENDFKAVTEVLDSIDG